MKFELDLHLHTISSGHAYSTVHDYIKIAKERKLKLIGLSDHGPSMPGGPNIFHIANQIVIPRVIEGITVLRGVEANIVDFDGNIDIPDEYLKRLDYVIGSLHVVTLKPGTKEENTSGVVKAIESGKVDILGHLGNPAYELDYKRIVEACKYHDVMIEINNSSFTSSSRNGSKEFCYHLADMAKEYGVKLIAGTDSHISYSLGEFEHCIELFNSCNIDKNTIMNVSIDKLIEYLKSKGRLMDL